MGFWSGRLRHALSRIITKGQLQVTLPDGSHAMLGDGTGPEVSVRVDEEVWVRRILLDPGLQLGEAYMSGALRIEAGNAYDLLDLIWTNIPPLSRNAPTIGARLQSVMRRVLRRVNQWNNERRAKENVHRHYDLGNDLYRLFLDQDMQYSCAYYPTPDISLDEAQRLKREHITRKLCLEPDQSVLDIGCGWGGLALHIAEASGAHVEGVTLSEEQLAVAKARAEAGLHQGEASFHLQDYRDLDTPYDRIVSVGMLEHVGFPQYHTYFHQVARLLKEDGVALIHTIGRPHGPGITSPWIRRRIFPGGYIPALSELLPAIERAGLTLLDAEVLRLHYAETLKAWRERFMANAEKAAEMYDDAFVRMWEFYLAASETSFRHGEYVVFQLQLGHSQTAAPLTRDYLYPKAENALARQR